MKIRNLGHAGINMEHEEEMLHFYRDILGMRHQFTMNWDVILNRFPKEPEDERAKAMVAELTAKKDQPWITYLKLADGQYLEFFHNNGKTLRRIENRWMSYGYTKMNLEVDSIEEMTAHLKAQGVYFLEDIHTVVDGSREISVQDPDGNEVQFTEYPVKGAGRIPLTENLRHTVCSRVSHLTQLAFQVQDGDAMRDFYTKGLGLKLAYTLTFGDLAAAMRSGAGDESADPALLALQAHANEPWIEYIEVTPHQFLELFHVLGEEKQEDRYLEDAYGYQHISLEVEDIHKAWDTVLANGLTPTTDISYGGAKSYQFWLKDPDGNRLELMQYVEESLQVQEPVYQPPIDEAQVLLDNEHENAYELVWDYCIQDGKEHPIAIICPGGGYGCVCSFVEGKPFAEYLNSKGISAVIVYYRLREKALYPNPQDDLARAVREVMDRAEELHLDMKNYSVWGSSAGGHLASTFGTETMGYVKYQLPKPAAEILIYPVITMNPEFTHIGSMEYLLGTDPSEEAIKAASTELHVTENYPPTYIWCGSYDHCVPPENTKRMARALKEAGVPYRCDIFIGPDHGIGLATGTSAEGWIDRAIEFWMKQI